jgi:hypothetical protein
MSIKFNDTQLMLLSGASQRDDHCLVPPTGSKRAQAQKAIVKLLEAGIVKEIRAKAGAPIWRRDEETGHTYALKLTAAGVKAIAVDEPPPSQGEAGQSADHLIVSVDPKPEPGLAPAAFLDSANDGAASTPKFPRGGTKIAGVIELLQGNDGVTLAELVANTGWLPHTARAALTGLSRARPMKDGSSSANAMTTVAFREVRWSGRRSRSCWTMFGLARSTSSSCIRSTG